jgi:hypothetical protein
MAISFFKLPRHKHFNYKPVFWDKAKEEREKRMKTAYEDKDQDYATALRERMEMRWKRSTGARERKSSNLRLIAILFSIGLVLYLIFFR